MKKMVISIHQVIGKVNPSMYAENGKALLKKYGSIDKIPAKEVKSVPLRTMFNEASNMYKFDEGGITVQHKLTYETYAESLEPVYYWILDFMNDLGLSPKKYVDNFTTSPGSNQFVDFAQRKGLTQDRVSKIMGDVNMVMRSVLNLIYDLKEFRIRLKDYDSFNSKDPNVKRDAILSLKQLWMDKVDMNKGNSSLKAMGLGQSGFQTLIDAFLFVNNDEDIKNLDLNERVKRILYPRVKEFNDWVESSEIELRKRYALEKNYLKSQVNSLKLYSAWVRPYMGVLSSFETPERDMDADLVTGFNRTILELTIMGKRKASLSSDAPDSLKDKIKRGRIKLRDYFQCNVVDFKFRTVPGQGVYMGRVDVTFSAYALNDEELKMVDQEFGNSGLKEIIELSQGATGESLDVLQKEIDEFLNEKTPEEEKAKKKEESALKDNSNPFLAVIGWYDKAPKSKKGEEEKEDEKITKIKPDVWEEKSFLRPVAVNSAASTHELIFEVYKKAHGMASYT